MHLRVLTALENLRSSAADTAEKTVIKLGLFFVKTNAFWIQL